MFSVMKATMDILGLRGGRMRLPLVDLKKEDKMELERVVLDRLKLTRIK
jgi:dihydrodipicolinate synthase/N-acetylneuraminate lyase